MPPPTLPDYSLETHHAAHAPIAGVDEAGRGPWAGPVMAAAVILHPQAVPEGLNDSKKLTAVRREALYSDIIEHAAAYSIAAASVDEIDTLNILGATKLAMQRAVAGLSVTPGFVLVDGNRPVAFDCGSECVVKGDSRSLSIAAASILAKVARDRLMNELHAHYPEYHFASHAGYGTAKHREALEKYGVTPYHRHSFAPIRALLMKQKESA